MTVIGIRPMIWESRARHSGLGPAGNGPNKCNNFASLERAASPQHSLKLHAIGVSLSVRRRQNESMRCHQLQHLCRETKFQEILQNPPKMGFRSTAHGSIRIQEGQPFDFRALFLISLLDSADHFEAHLEGAFH